MIKIEKTEVVGWEAAIRGMRNPLRSHAKSDSDYCDPAMCDECCFQHDDGLCYGADLINPFVIGTNDYDLMEKLAKAGSTHRKYLRMIVVYVDITAPLYWWKEYSTYKVGTVSNSESTMHTIEKREFTMDDFSHEYLTFRSREYLRYIIDLLNQYRNIYLKGGTDCDDFGDEKIYPPKSKDIWWQMIQLLPSSYNQKRTLMLNYEVLTNIYHTRKNHKLEEWNELCEWIESLPYSELITGIECQTKVVPVHG